jgi:hypothetical protein
MKDDINLAKELLEIQNLAISIAEETFNELAVGITEIEAATLLKDKATDKGITKYFHYPFAWFGERTMFKDFSQPLPLLTKSTWKKIQLPKSLKELPHFGKEFMPTNKRLEKDMPVILDLAPMKNGVFADIGFSQYFGHSAEYENMISFLIKLKKQIPEIIKNERCLSKIYSHIDTIIHDNGFINCHSLYPLGVLGHKVGNYPKLKIPLPKLNLMGFPLESFVFLFGQDLGAPFYYSKKTPYLAGHIKQDISNGFWAIEPHIGYNDMGAKFEEILVIDGDSVSWLNQ